MNIVIIMTLNVFGQEHPFQKPNIVADAKA
jgi:hypothetical protein